MFKKGLFISLLVGIVLTIIGLIILKGDISGIIKMYSDDENFEYISDSGDETVDTLSLDLVSNDIKIFYSEDENYRVEYYSSKYNSITHSLNNGKLSLIAKVKKKTF